MAEPMMFTVPHGEICVYVCLPSGGGTFVRRFDGSRVSDPGTSPRDRAIMRALLDDAIDQLRAEAGD
jgi:hypothetical protein